MVVKYFDVTYLTLVFTLWESLVYIVLLPLGFAFGRVLFGRYLSLKVPQFSLSKALVEKDNKAVAIAFSGFEVAMGLVMWGGISDQDKDNSALNLAGGLAWTAMGFVFLMLAVVINDLGLWFGHPVLESIENGNIAAGYSVAASYIAAGQVALYTISGGGKMDWGAQIGSAVLFFVLCQLWFVASFYITMMVFSRFGWLKEEIIKGNVATGLVSAFVIVSSALLATNSLKKTEELLAFAVWSILGQGLLMLVSFFVDFVLLHKIDTSGEIKGQQHWGVALVLGACMLAFATALTGILEGSCAYTLAQFTTFGERLTMTSATQNLFRWSNAIRVAGIFIYMFVSKAIYALPHIFCYERDDAAIEESKATFFEALTDFLRVPPRYKKRLQRRLQEMDAEMSDKQQGVAETLVMSQRTNTSLVLCEDDDVGRVARTRAVTYAGYVISIGVMVRSCYLITNGASQSGSDQLMYGCFWIAVGAMLQHAGYYVQRFVLWGCDAPSSEYNLAASIVDAALYVTVGLQIGSNLVKNGQGGEFDLSQDVTDVAIFFSLQMALIAIAGHLYRFITKFDDKAGILEGNVAVAVCNAGTMLATGVLASAPTQRTDEILTLLVFFVLGVIILQVVRLVIVDKVIMPSQELDQEIIRDHNWGAALCEGVISVMMAACMESFLRELCFGGNNVSPSSVDVPSPTSAP